MKTMEFGTMYRTCVYIRQRNNAVPDIEKLLEIMEGEQYFYNQISEKYVYSLIIIHFICNNVAIIIL